MDFKAVIPVVIGALVALILFELFVKKMVSKDSFESLDENLDD